MNLVTYIIQFSRESVSERILKNRLYMYLWKMIKSQVYCFLRQCIAIKFYNKSLHSSSSLRPSKTKSSCTKIHYAALSLYSLKLFNIKHWQHEYKIVSIKSKQQQQQQTH